MSTDKAWTEVIPTEEQAFRAEALRTATFIHGAGSASTYSGRIRSTDDEVLESAQRFYDWIRTGE
jgi:hypothetical protein